MLASAKSASPKLSGSSNRAFGRSWRKSINAETVAIAAQDVTQQFWSVETGPWLFFAGSSQSWP